MNSSLNENVISSFIDSVVSEKLSFFIKLRWLAGLAIVTTVLVAKYIFMVPMMIQVLLPLSAVVFLYNLVFYIIYKKSQIHFKNGENLSFLFYLFHAQIILDLFMLALLIHFSGGIENPFIYFFNFHIIIASILLFRRSVWIYISLIVLLMGFMVLLEATGIIAHHSLNILQSGIHTKPAFVVSNLMVLSITLIITGIIARSITIALRNREKALQNAKNELEELEKHKSDFLQITAHQLSSPAAMVSSSLSTILSLYSDSLDPKIKEIIERSEKKTDDMVDMIRDLLELARIRSMKSTKEIEEIDINETLNHIYDRLKDKASSKHINLSIEAPKPLPMVKGNKKGIFDVFYNLTENALKYTPEQGEVKVYVDYDERYLYASVSDTGIGIPESNLNHIFEDFYRASNAKKQKISGTGLGLAIVKKIIENHKGEIKVESKENQGTTFHFTLSIS